MHSIIEIGSLREPVELLEAPSGPPCRRIGRIRHANGENVAIDHETLERLTARARAAREGDAVFAPRRSATLMA